MRGLRRLEWRSYGANGCECPRLLLRLYSDQAGKTLSRVVWRFPSVHLGLWSGQRPDYSWPQVVRVHQPGDTQESSERGRSNEEGTRVSLRSRVRRLRRGNLALANRVIEATGV